MKFTLLNPIQKSLVLASFILLSINSYAQKTYTDTVCAGKQDVVYGILGANGGSTYNWWLGLNGGGSIDNSHAANDSVIQVDWSAASGTYTLFCQEVSSNGCMGDTVQLDIVINPKPTVVVTGDSVCGNAPASLTFAFTGNGPWTVDYTDGTNQFSQTTAVTPHMVNLPTYSSSKTITVTNLIDYGQCVADTSSLPTTTIYIAPKPVTGGIYHY